KKPLYERDYFVFKGFTNNCYLHFLKRKSRVNKQTAAAFAVYRIFQREHTIVIRNDVQAQTGSHIQAVCEKIGLCKTILYRVTGIGKYIEIQGNRNTVKFRVTDKI